MKSEENISDSIKEAIISYYAGVLSEDEALNLLNWVSQSPINLKQFHILGEIWHLIGSQTDHEFNATTALGTVKKKISSRKV